MCKKGLFFYINTEQEEHKMFTSQKFYVRKSGHQRRKEKKEDAAS